MTSEILGPVRNGGIGTATSGLVDHLSGDGHQVTVLFTSVEHGVPACDEKDWPHWVSALARRNVELAHIPHGGDYRMWRRKSWLVKEFLAEREFDVVYFNEHHGSGYYALAAKRAGLTPFARQTHCVITHGSIEWVINTNDQGINRPSDLEMIGLERRSAEWADVVLGPSEYLLREYESYGWRLPERTYTQPYPFQDLGVEPDPSSANIDELVFFGRLEPRKGLWLFCEALDHLGDRLRGHRVTFMGRMTEIGSIPSAAFILERSARWPFQVRLLTRFGQAEALDYLRRPGRLAVMPSLADNSPCVVYECMGNRIPFVTTSGSGAEELIHPDCRDRVMVEPNVRALSDRLRDILDHGAGFAWPRFDAAENLRTWSTWSGWLGSRIEEPDGFALDEEPPLPPDEQRTLLVTIDAGLSTLGGLSEQVGLHLQRFGPSVRHVVLTSRLGPARKLLDETLSPVFSADGVDGRTIGADSIGSLLEAIGSCDVVFFTDAEHEVLPTFFVAAMVALARTGAAIVSCVSAERRVPDGALEIAELPCGDLPAAGGLGLPIGSSVWAARSEEILGELTPEMFHRSETGELIDAAPLGQALMHRIMTSDRDVLLIPSVGAVRRREVGAFRQRRHWYQGAQEAAEALRLCPIVHPDGLAWLGLNAAQSTKAVEEETLAGFAQDSGHPINLVRQTGRSVADLAMLSAALSRPDQAIRLQAGWDSDLHASAVLLDVAQRTAEARRPVDLRAGLLALRSGSSTPASAMEMPPETASHDFRDRLIAAIARQRSADQRERSDPRFLAAEDATWRNLSMESVGGFLTDGSQGPFSDIFQIDPAADYGVVSLAAGRPARSGRLTFIDVLLAGHERIVADLSLGRSLPVQTCLSVIDQATGGTIAKAEAQDLGQGVLRLAADLHGVFGVVAVSLVFEARSDTLRLPFGFRLNRFLID
ncbi:glycosyltransferase family 4 protein [Rubellimicrobium rubrum]|uniref:glycosyltransferase family 4 protein n=1 Tax=Rubellimicrobium rubrum TaxID=2585369 RepID=UPI00159BD044|nr:glycosyltransferase family 4 protein [Rubellimicrobium rubrum]